VRSRWGWLVAVALVPGLPAPAADDQPADYPRDVRPLLVRYCYDCHGEGSAKGEVALDDRPSGADGALWQRVASVLRTERMPPVGKAQPNAAERARLVGWIRTAVLGIDCRAPDPGRVTLRRLNRYEYSNTIQDLFGIDFQPGESFPPDDTGYGFDNNGDVLGLSPLLLDKYFTAAEAVVARVVAERPELPVHRITSAQMTEVAPAVRGVVTREARFNLPDGGPFKIQLRVALNSFNPFKGLVQARLLLDDGTLWTRRLPAVNRSYPVSLRRTIAAGDHVVRLVADTRQIETATAPPKLDLEIVARGPDRPQAERWPEAHRAIFFEGEPPSDAQRRAAYAREILRRVASRAFRRPVDEATLDRLVGLAGGDPSADGFRRGVAHALQAILVSPRFLFRVEPSAASLDEYALASRLSYFLWAGPPDQHLLALAGAGQLRAHLAETVEALVADRRSDRFVASFVGQWLRSRDVLGVPVDRKRWPGQSSALRTAMRDETELLFAHVMREDRDVLELVDARYTFLNDVLAAHYHLPAVEGGAMRKVELPPDSERGGILTHAGVLLVTSNPTRTSPVKRGLFVLENLLGVPPPPPPPNVPALDEARAHGEQPRSVRQQLEAHRADSRCANCHARMDPIGLALENFDMVGRWRDHDEGGPIDARGQLPGGEAIGGVADLRRVLRGRRTQLYDTVARKLLTYALGRGLGPADDCAVEEIVARTAAAKGKFRALLLALVESVPFQQHRVEAPSIEEDRE
jgi:hypothetical protein